MNAFTVGDVIRHPHYPTVGHGSYRVWKIIGVHLGATHQEGTYELEPLDIRPNHPIQVPCILLESIDRLERV